MAGKTSPNFNKIQQIIFLENFDKIVQPMGQLDHPMRRKEQEITPNEDEVNGNS